MSQRRKPTKHRSPAWLSRNVWTLSWVSLLQDAAGELLYPAHLQLKAQARLQGFSGFGILIAGIWAGLAWNVGAGIDLSTGLSLGDGGAPMLIAAGFAILVAVYVAIFAPRSGHAPRSSREGVVGTKSKSGPTPKR